MAKVIDVPGYGPTEFPDSMDDAAIVAAIQKTMVPAKQAEIKQSPPQLTTGERLKRGFVDSPVEGLLQLAAETEIADMIAPEWAKRKKAEIQQKEADYQSRRTAHNESGVDWTRLAGEVANPANIAIASATKTPPGMSMVGRAGLGALGGGMMGLLSPVYGDNTREGNAALGGIGGALAAPLTGGAARVVKPNVRPEIELLRKEGITPTMGQTMGGALRNFEDKLTSVPILGDAINSAKVGEIKQLNQAVYNRALKPIGMKHSGTIGMDGVAEVRQKLSDGYNAVLGNVTLKPDAKFTQDFTALTNSVGQMMPAEQTIYKRIIDRLNNRTPGSVMDGKTLKSVQTTLDTEIDKLSRDGSYEKLELADTLEDLRTMLSGAMQRSNPMQAKRLQSLDEGWANYAILRDAAYKSAKRNSQHDLFTPADLTAAVTSAAQRKESKNAAKGIVSEGDALMQDLSDASRRTLPSTYPDSGTAGRIAAILGTAGGMSVAPTAAAGTLGGLSLASLPYLPYLRKGADAMLNGRQGPKSQALAELLRRNPAAASPLLYGPAND